MKRMINFPSKEMNRKVKLIENNSIPSEENIYLFVIYKFEVGSKLGKKTLMNYLQFLWVKKNIFNILWGKIFLELF